MNDNAKKWVEALRSGDYKQTRGYLTKLDPVLGEAHCCMGVACVLYIEDGNELETVSQSYSTSELHTVRYGRYSVALPPQEVADWLGLGCADGQYQHPEGGAPALVTLNDSGASFAYIADLIESEPKGLFVG